jgi:acyl carrier protein
MINTSSLEAVRSMLIDLLGLEDRADQVDADTALFAAMPEFDSLAILQVISELEERLGIEMDDADINAEVFATVRSLSEYVDGRLGEHG